jgi:hypothetical protein
LKREHEFFWSINSHCFFKESIHCLSKDYIDEPEQPHTLKD